MLQSKSKDSPYNYKIVGVYIIILVSLSYLYHRINHITSVGKQKNVIANYRNIAHFAQYQESYCSRIY